MTLKTSPNQDSVAEFLNSIQDKNKREDCNVLCALIGEITGEQPVMWGDSIVGFGSYHYAYRSGREGDWFLTGFSPRKQNITVYVMNGFDHYQEHIEKLGKVKTSVSCLYLRRLSDIDLNVLKELLRDSVACLKAKYQ